MDPKVTAEVARIARRQKWMITHAQATGAGVSESTIARWVRQGTWVRVRRGVYMVPGAVDSWELRALSAVLAVGDGAVLSHASAGHLWRLPACPRPGHFELWVAPNNGHRIVGAVLHRTARLDDREITVNDGVPVTTVTRTICDLAATKSTVELADAIAFALRTRKTTLNRLAACGERLVKAPGIGRLRAAIGEVDEDAARRSESGLEQRARTALVTRGVPPPVVNPRLKIAGRKRRPDLAWMDVKVGLEIFGPHHLLPSQRVLDGIRGQEFTSDGWVLVYATDDELDHPDQLVADLTRLIASRRS